MFSFDQVQFDRIFPFYFILDRDLKITSAGKALIKLMPDILNTNFSRVFTVYRPHLTSCTFNELLQKKNELLVLEQKQGSMRLRCQVEFLERTDNILLIGSPWFTSVEDVLDKGLILSDFAIHDPVIDLLHVLKTQEIANDDMKELVNRLNRQKKELKAANQKISDIALFPTQNPDPIIRIDVNGNIIQKNPAADALSAFDLYGKKWEQDHFWKHVAKKIITNEDRQTFEASSNGEIYSFLMISLREEGYYNIYGRQITMQKKIADELSSTANRLSSLIQNLYAGVLLEDEHRRIALVNEEFCEIFNIEAETNSLIGSDWSRSPEYSKQLFTDEQGFIEGIEKVLEERMPELDKLLEMKDGRTLQRDFIPIWANEKYKGHLWLYIDVTEKINAVRQIGSSEKRYRDVFENSLALIMTHDLNGKILSINPRVSEVFGFTQEEMIGKTLTDFISKEDRPTFDEVYLPELSSQKQMTGVIKVSNKKGNEVYTLFNNYLKEEEGEEAYVIGYGVDITDRINAENELKKAKIITEKLSNAKQEFLANMSHEIRTPLNAILGLSHQLLKTPLNADQSKYANTITEASDHLLSIVNDILDMSKIDAGKLAVESIGFELKNTIETAVQVVAYKAQEKGLKLERPRIDKELAAVHIGDPHRINQVLFNLLSNAVKYTEKGSVNLRCEVIQDEAMSQMIRIQVEDTGVGMDEGFLSRLFEKFSQDRNLDKEIIGGTGLGMSITKKLVDLMNGDIHVKSEKGKGTLVSVTLTMEKGKRSDLPKMTRTTEDKDFLSGYTILVVDDNENNRLVSSVILENYGAQIIEAEDGQAALDAISIERPDAILMDLQMPTLNGLEATRIIRKLGLSIPILALTANVVKGEREQCLRAGMNDYLSKPFKEKELLQKLAHYLQFDLHVKKVGTKNGAVLKVESAGTYDLSKLHQISQGNDTFVKRMLEVFCKNVPGLLSEMNSALRAQDKKKLRQLAHKLKPSVQDLNILEVISPVTELAAEESQDIPILEVGTMVSVVTNTIDRVIEQIRSDLSRM